MQAMLALGLPVLLETILTLVGEHFATAHDLGYRRHRTFTHLLSLILIGDIIAGILYATWVGEKSIGDTVQAYIILQFVFLALLILHQLFRMRHLCFATGIFLLALVSLRRVAAPVGRHCTHTMRRKHRLTIPVRVTDCS